MALMLHSHMHNHTNKSESQAVSPENVNEAIFLFCIACIGLISNSIVVIFILSRRHLRTTASAFIVHECVLDAVRCLYCFPFAVSLLWDMAPGFCATLGGSYVVVVTASSFNIVAMVCCEAYVFGEKNLEIGDGGLKGTEETNEHSNICCVVFGVLMVHAASMIIHLGPTIIGGDFSYNDLIGNCIFMYGTIKSYVAQVMWIVIVTLSMLGTIYYLAYFHKHIQKSTHNRLSALHTESKFFELHTTYPEDDFQAATTPIFTTTFPTNYNTNLTAYKEQSIQNFSQKTFSRCRVLMVITGVFIISWYPLYILTLLDPKFQQPSKIYKLLTFIAWSNAAINPFIFVLFDQQITFNFRCLWSTTSSSCFSRTARSTSMQLEPKEPPRPLSKPVQKRIGNRLFQEGFTINHAPMPIELYNGRREDGRC